MNQIIKKNGINFGIILGIVSVLITTSIYIIDLKLFTASWLGILNIIIYLGVAIYLLSKTKKEVNGNFSFKDAFTTYFISAIIGIVISVAFNIILFNVIDTEAKGIIQENLIEFQVNMLKKFNMPTAEIKKAVEKMSAENQFDVMPQLKGSVFSILFSAIVGAILGFIFKSKPQEQV